MFFAGKVRKIKTERSNNPEGEIYAIGIDVGPSRARAAILDSGLDLVDELALPVKGVRGAGEKCMKIVGELIDKSGIPPKNIGAIGIGAGPKLRSIAQKIGKKFNADFAFGENAYCAALGEKHLNDEAAGVEDLLYVYSDLGWAVILKGEDAKAVSPEDSAYLRPWHASLGISEIAKREVARGVGTKIVTAAKGDIGLIDDGAVLEAARLGDEVAANILHSVGVNLGLRMAYLVNLFNPALILLGGGLEKAQDALAGPITKIVGKLSLKSKYESLKIERGKLGGNAVVIGAAFLAKNKRGIQ